MMILVPACLASADSVAGAARELADRITAIVGPLENIEITFRNLTSLGAREAAERWQSVEKEFRSRGMRFARESEGSAKITLTLSENPRNYLWTAEIQRDQARDLVFVTQVRPPGAQPADALLQTNIQARLMIEQIDPILDVAFFDGNLLALSPSRLSLYSKENGHWVLQTSAAVPNLPAQPRDARGRLRVSGDGVQAYLPGMLCVGSLKPALSLECTQGQAPWPLETGPESYDSERNFFLREDVPPFYSVSGIKDEGGQLWIFSAVDGRTRLYDGSMKLAGTINGWGSETAGVDTGCGSRRQILALLPADPAARGSVQAFEVVRRQPVAVSPPAELPGPVTSLWPISAEDGAVAVVRDIKTGRYAAYQLSITCGN